MLYIEKENDMIHVYTSSKYAGSILIYKKNDTYEYVLAIAGKKVKCPMHDNNPIHVIDIDICKNVNVKTQIHVYSEHGDSGLLIFDKNILVVSKDVAILTNNNCEPIAAIELNIPFDRFLIKVLMGEMFDCKQVLIRTSKETIHLHLPSIFEIVNIREL